VVNKKYTVLSQNVGGPLTVSEQLSQPQQFAEYGNVVVLHSLCSPYFASYNFCLQMKDQLKGCNIKDAANGLEDCIARGHIW
jgi:hypothetical protein